MFKLLKWVVDAINPPPVEYEIPEYVPVLAIESGCELYIGALPSILDTRISVRVVACRRYSWREEPFTKYVSSRRWRVPNYLILHFVGPGKLPLRTDRYLFLHEANVYKLWMPLSLYKEYVDE